MRERIPDYFGQVSDGTAPAIGAPALAMPNQPSRAIQPIGVQQSGSEDPQASPAFAHAATVMQSNPDARIGEEELQSLRKKRKRLDSAMEDFANLDDPTDLHNINGVTNALAQTAQGLQAMQPAKFSFLPGANRKNRQDYTTRVQAMKGREETLKGLAEIYDKYGKEGLDLAAQAHNRYKDYVDTAEALQKEKHQDVSEARQQDLATSLIDARKQGVDIRQAYLKIRQQLAPHQVAALDAAVFGNDVRSMTGLAGLPYAAPTKAAQLTLLKQAPGIKAYNAASGRMGATGLQLPGAGEPPPGMVPPPPPEAQGLQPQAPVVAQPATNPQLTPKAQMQNLTNEQATALKKEQTQAQHMKNVKEQAQLSDDAAYAWKRQLKKNYVDADFWRKNSELFDALSEEDKQAVKARYLKQQQAR